MINKLKGLLNKDKYHRKIFAVNHGTHKGHFYVYISTDEKQHNFLVLPEIDTISIEHETFETGLRKTVQWYLDNRQWWERVLSGAYRLERLGE